MHRPPFPLERVTWLDHYSEDDWQKWGPGQPIAPHPGVTVGYVIHEDAAHVVLAQTVAGVVDCAGEWETAARMVLLKATITAREALS